MANYKKYIDCHNCIHFGLCEFANDFYEITCDDFIDKADVIETEKVAEMFAEQFGDECPCNFNGIDEWLPFCCEYANTCDCSTKDGWKQFIKHYEERKESE